MGAPNTPPRMASRPVRRIGACTEEQQTIRTTTGVLLARASSRAARRLARTHPTRHALGLFDGSCIGRHSSATNTRSWEQTTGTHTQHPPNAARPARCAGRGSGSIHTTPCDIRPSDKRHTFRVASAIGICSPEQIRTAVTALRGRRPRPLDDGAEQRFRCESVGQKGVQPPL